MRQRNPVKICARVDSTMDRAHIRERERRDLRGNLFTKRIPAAHDLNRPFARISYRYVDRERITERDLHTWARFRCAICLSWSIARTGLKFYLLFVAPDSPREGICSLPD